MEMCTRTVRRRALLLGLALAASAACGGDDDGATDEPLSPEEARAEECDTQFAVLKSGLSYWYRNNETEPPSIAELEARNVFGEGSITAYETEGGQVRLTEEGEELGCVVPDEEEYLPSTTAPSATSTTP